uniref:Peroxin-7 n=1 Tax=Otus sunia TaxID=257818 RepID=A0A8C8E726_9STRI
MWITVGRCGAGGSVGRYGLLWGAVTPVSPPQVFCSCSADASLRVWDVRAPPGRRCQLWVGAAHAAEINALSWSRRDPALLSGADDGSLRLWDLRRLQVRPAGPPHG